MRWIWSIRRTWGTTALGVWLVATGLLPFLHVSTPQSGPILSLLAAAAGILILIQR
jgi:hypothetical protein